MCIYNIYCIFNININFPLFFAFLFPKLKNKMLDWMFLFCLILTGISCLAILNWISVFYMLKDLDVIRRRFPKYLFVIGILSFLAHFERLFGILVNAHYIHYQHSILIIYIFYYILSVGSEYIIVARALKYMFTVNFCKSLEDTLC